MMLASTEVAMKRKINACVTGAFVKPEVSMISLD